jgi:putative transposase
VLLIQRGYQGAICFFDGDDYLSYKECLLAAIRELGASLHAYCLLPDRVELLLTPPDVDSIAPLLSRTSRDYACYREQRCGARVMLWDSHYKGQRAPADGRLLQWYRHVENQPLSQGVARSVAAYRWSSHHHNAYGLSDTLVTPHPVFLALVEQGSARQRYRSLFAAGKAAAADAPQVARAGPGEDLTALDSARPSAA